MYIADSWNNRIRKVTVSTGTISTIAGSGATGTASGSFGGDSKAATSATLNVPPGVALDSTGTHSLFLYFLRHFKKFFFYHNRQRVHRRSR